ncbi:MULTISPECIES: tRNA (adenosine(37)-N6)-threonylcarbamoyltransferase complex dimerization subunit type 1 TsaB [unclassified Frigoribacterium]|uniref:tRNA (adenosine(37)-N6)-threonylcarbamoyltransferase complex dimerization subunit type 1 TsaB n=1 Tax=unclassified Frigoribacterium TaxID=2627005 RepID=UPI0006F446FC|nr:MULTISPECIES: tRNA (adenosine(37)-N6)-threonylcarbamoyltransferase complex dimerization subunit type 1 TsaB [unclassified Frigoribacterium]KQO81803.1 tRNA threonylcarbamoyladenosine biosynthesis protein TsaB [Frigoribacterium sp. Leaf263]KQR66150.1 tRNA threonylcarbamoyladenosine biosynthesis protein TsaB [Frigoribacterium sp. Leaf172]
MILAIDTSAGTTVAVVDRDRGVLAERTETDTRRHAEVVGTLIESALAGAGVVPTDLSAVVAGVGPGPYTGLRVGIVAARAFAFGIGRPCLAVASHDAVAFERLSTGAGGSGSVATPSGRLDAPLVVVTDARRREVAWTAYRGLDADGLPVPLDGPTLARPAELDGVLGEAAAWPRTDPDDTAVSAAALGMLAERLFEHGREFAGPAPLYLREPDVTVSAGPKPVGR